MTRSLNSGTRSSRVMEALAHAPWTSGLPGAVRGMAPPACACAAPVMKAHRAQAITKRFMVGAIIIPGDRATSESSRMEPAEKLT